MIPARTSAARSVVGGRPRRSTPTEMLTEAAARYGKTRRGMRARLDAAGVAPRRTGRYLVAEVDAALKKPEHTPGAHLPDAEGRVACGPCWAIAVITRGRVTTCRWCRGSASW